ncbi:hypothetical protein CDAR_536111 [Caerostris darwini]|uniref:Uncharacterized protein n=1 Tax=Caerostris darwini TaxID=1538125 RepID=A0AAV4V674_9ARAC|nr:hypothetical protein CDAR_536111 [Caerostris darwini]
MDHVWEKNEHVTQWYGILGLLSGTSRMTVTMSVNRLAPIDLPDEVYPVSILNYYCYETVILEDNDLFPSPIGRFSFIVKFCTRLNYLQ